MAVYRPNAISNAGVVQGRRQEAHDFFRMIAQGSMQPLAPAGDAAALLMHDLLRHGDPAAAVGFFQTLPRMPVRPPPSASLVAVAVDAFVACGQWTDAAATLASGSRNSAAAPAAAVSLMCNMARTATALPRDAQELDVLVKTAHEVRGHPRHTTSSLQMTYSSTARTAAPLPRASAHLTLLRSAFTPVRSPPTNARASSHRGFHTLCQLSSALRRALPGQPVHYQAGRYTVQSSLSPQCDPKRAGDREARVGFTPQGQYHSAFSVHATAP